MIKMDDFTSDCYQMNGLTSPRRKQQIERSPALPHRAETDLSDSPKEYPHRNGGMASSAYPVVSQTPSLANYGQSPKEE